MMRGFLFLFLFFVFIILWIIFWLAVHITAGFIHILLVLAVLFLILHFVRRRPAA